MTTRSAARSVPARGRRSQHARWQTVCVIPVAHSLAYYRSPRWCSMLPGPMRLPGTCSCSSAAHDGRRYDEGGSPQHSTSITVSCMTATASSRAAVCLCALPAWVVVRRQWPSSPPWQCSVGCPLPCDSSSSDNSSNDSSSASQKWQQQQLSQQQHGGGMCDEGGSPQHSSSITVSCMKAAACSRVEVCVLP